MQRLSVPIWLPENAPPPRNRAALRGSFSPPVVLPHALACGLVLLLVMALLGVLPACAELSCARGLLFLGALDALLHGFRRLSAASVASGSPALGVGGRGQCGQDQEEGEGLSRLILAVERNSGELKSMGWLSGRVLSNEQFLSAIQPPFQPKQPATDTSHLHKQK